MERVNWKEWWRRLVPMFFKKKIIREHKRGHPLKTGLRYFLNEPKPRGLGWKKLRVSSVQNPSRVGIQYIIFHVKLYNCCCLYYRSRLAAALSTTAASTTAIVNNTSTAHEWRPRRLRRLRWWWLWWCRDVDAAATVIRDDDGPLLFEVIEVRSWLSPPKYVRRVCFIWIDGRVRRHSAAPGRRRTSVLQTVQERTDGVSKRAFAPREKWPAVWRTRVFYTPDFFVFHTYSSVPFCAHPGGSGPPLPPRARARPRV